MNPNGPIDAHQHFWQYSPDQYPWISDAMPALKHDFLPQHLEQALSEAGMAASIAVQARQTLAETEWLLQLAADHPAIAGVVGWLPLEEVDVRDALDRLPAGERLCGVRHLIQDEPDDDYILGERFNRGVRILTQAGLAYDILIHTRHLPQTIEFVDRHPNQQFVLDHCAKPPLRSGELGFWRQQIRQLAERQNVSCKLSGLVTEADWAAWKPAQVEICWQTVLESFGPGRLLFGSDWPVLLLASEYGRWVELVQSWTAPLTQSERESIWGNTARRVYRLR